MRLLKVVCGALALASLGVTGAGAASPTLQFRVFARTGLRLTGVVWTGQQFLYVDNTTNRVMTAPPTGMPLAPFAAMPKQVEETRCAMSPGTHGFSPGDVFCHSPDNKIYRISADGKSVTLFASLPHSARSDGALTFDTVGHFDYALIAATGRSGGASPRGGNVFAIDPAGKVRLIGSYGNPGGADEAAIAPAGFGTAAGQVLLTVDAGKTGSLVAVDAQGRARTLVNLSDGPNPIVVLGPGQTPPSGAAQPGVYVTDTLSHNVYFAPASEFASLSNQVLLGSELRAFFWVVAPNGSGFAATRLSTNLDAKNYNLEGVMNLGSG
jgi:hypothetical protein